MVVLVKLLRVAQRLHYPLIIALIIVASLEYRAQFTFAFVFVLYLYLSNMSMQFMH